MTYRDTIVTTVIILLLLSVLVSGCTGEKKSTPASESLQKEVANVSGTNLTQSSIEKNMPEIKITTFSSLYLHDNSDFKDIYLFNWDNVPGNESERFLSFLKNESEHHWLLQEILIESPNWLENAQMNKSDKNNTIRIFDNHKSIELKLENSQDAVFVDIRKLYLPEKIDGFKLLVKHENGKINIYNREFQNKYKYDISEGYYAAYNLIIKNNGSDTIYFKLNDLQLYDGNQTINTTALPPYGLEDLEKENKIQDTTLLPGQSLNRTVVFRVDSLYNKSFLLIYNTTPLTSTSFEKSIEALRTAESFNYSVALGLPPYCNCSERGGTTGSYEPKFDDYCDTFANWVNRSIFETFQKSDLERMRKSPPGNIPLTKMEYSLKVFPEKNITMFPVTTREFSSNLLVIDDTGKEMINTSNNAGVAVLYNQTYTLFKPRWKLIMPRMNFSNVSVVQISFEGIYGEPMGQRLSFVNQDVILDEGLNIIAVRYSRDQFVS